MSSVSSGSLRVVDEHFFGIALAILRRWWWIIGLASALVAASVFFYVAAYDVRYESVAVVRGWRDAVTRRFVSARELEVLANSADLLREAHRASAPAAGAKNVAYLNRGVVIRVQWLPASELMSLTATGSDPEATQRLLISALPLLFRAIAPKQETLDQLQAERQALLETLNTLQDAVAAVVARDKMPGPDEATATRITAMQLSFLPGTAADITAVIRQLNELDAEAFAPSERSIVQWPTRANGPLPNRVAATSILAAMGSMLVGLAMIILVAFTRLLDARRRSGSGA